LEATFGHIECVVGCGSKDSKGAQGKEENPTHRDYGEPFLTSATDDGFDLFELYTKAVKPTLTQNEEKPNRQKHNLKLALLDAVWNNRYTGNFKVQVSDGESNEGQIEDQER